MLMLHHEPDTVLGRLVGKPGQLLYQWINATSYVVDNRNNLRADVDGMVSDVLNGSFIFRSQGLNNISRSNYLLLRIQW